MHLSLNFRFKELSVHLLVWGSLTLIPFTLSYLQGGEREHTIRTVRLLTIQVEYMFIFYLNYALLINRYLFGKKVAKFMLANLLAITAVRLIVFIGHDAFFPFPPHPERGIAAPLAPAHGFQLHPFIIGALSLVMVAGTSVAIKVTMRWYEAQAKMAVLKKEKAAVELQQLKSQLNPHFLFNSLNNIYALIAFNPRSAQLAVHNLSDMLRYQLYEASKDRISLRKEVELVRDYCNLMKLRLTENVKLTLSLPENDEDIAIAPMLFITLVENAFKHGVSAAKPSRISISIAVEEGRSVACTVRNTSFPKTDKGANGSGIGLENLCKRLELLYPNRHQWTAKKEKGEFIAQIRIF
jgi:two-component sensor histidine kinase